MIMHLFTLLHVQWFMSKNKTSVFPHPINLLTFLIHETFLCFQCWKGELKGKTFNDILEIWQNSQQMYKALWKKNSRHAPNNGRITRLGVLPHKGSIMKQNF